MAWKKDGDVVESCCRAAPDAVQCRVACVSDEDNGVVFGSSDLLFRSGFSAFLPLPFPFSLLSLGSGAQCMATKWRRAMDDR